MTEGLVPVLVGFTDPDTPDAPASSRRQERSELARPGIDWAGLGVVPRWIGMESSDCAAALEPGVYHNRGARERNRYIAGAGSRSEMALLISTMGDADSTRRNTLSVYDASLSLSLESGCVGGRRLPSGATVSLADNLNRADRDLALRLKNRPPGVWWALKLEPSEVVWDGSGGPLGPVGPDGNLAPLLVDGLGDPVAAVWTSPQVDLRWYIVPDRTDWPTVVSWLVEQALPAYVPGALRRTRSQQHVDEDLQTTKEAGARQALADLEEQYERDKAALEQQLRSATDEAAPVRDGLLYGTGWELVDAVRAVLIAAGFEVHDLDDELGGTKSADLFAIRDGNRCLIEVKSASGNAGEGLAGDLRRHISTWPALQPAQQLTHSALIVNHQYRRAPGERSGQVYARAEFVSSLPFPVLSARQLFDWWRASDWPAITSAILASAPQIPQDGAPPPGRQSQQVSAGKPARSWLSRRRGKPET